MKKSRTFKNDESGVSSINAIFGILLISILIWQFGMPYIDDSIPTFTDFIQTQGTEIYASWGLYNTNTSEFISASDLQVMYYEPGNIIQMILYSNVPYKLTNPYHVAMRVYESGDLIGGFYEPVGFNAIYLDEFRYNINIDTMEGLDYEFQVSIFDFNENAIQGMPYNMFLHNEV